MSETEAAQIKVKFHELVQAAQADNPVAWRQLGILGLNLRSANTDYFVTCLSKAQHLGDRLASALLSDFSYVANGKDVAFNESNMAALENDLENHLQLQPERESICTSPDITYTEGFFSEIECSYLINLAADHLRPATVRDEGVSRLNTDVRFCKSVSVRRHDQDLIVRVIANRIDKLTNMQAKGAESLSIIRYEPGGFYKAHFDDKDSQYYEQTENLNEDQKKGPRTISFLGYLNDKYDGGETAFVSPKIKIKGQPGAALFFPNLTDYGERDPTTRHAGMPVVSGEKWICTQWYRRGRQ